MGGRSSTIVETPTKTEINGETCIFRECKKEATSTIWINVNHSPGYNHPKMVGLLLCKEHSNITSFNAACNCTHEVTGLPEHLVGKPVSKKYEYVIIYQALMSDPSEVIRRPDN